MELATTLEVLDATLDTHQPDASRFRAAPVPAEHVVLFDDTYTRGATSLSAARTLFEAGASAVTIVDWSPQRPRLGRRRLPGNGRAQHAGRTDLPELR